MTDPAEVRPHQIADFDQNFAKVNADFDRFVAVFRDVRALGPGPRALDIAGLAGHLSEIGTVPGLADLLAAAIVRIAEPAPPTTDQQAERMADAYNLGIKAEALREFANHLDADLPPARPLPPHVIATLARERAEDLDAEAEELATTAESAPPAELTEAQRHAERIIRDLSAIVDWDLVHDRISDAAGTGTIDRAAVLALIDSATVTVSWPEPAAPEQDGGQAEGER